MLIPDLIDKLHDIFAYFGEQTQRAKLAEECQEYIESGAILDDEEIADVFIVSAQIVLNNRTVSYHVKSKIERTLRRIENGYYKDMRAMQNPQSRTRTP